MADAEDLKSSGDFSSCGFDSHPGHHFICSQIIELRSLSVTLVLFAWLCRTTLFLVLFAALCPKYAQTLGLYPPQSASLPQSSPLHSLCEALVGSLGQSAPARVVGVSVYRELSGSGAGRAVLGCVAAGFELFISSAQ